MFDKSNRILGRLEWLAHDVKKLERAHMKNGETINRMCAFIEAQGRLRGIIAFDAEGANYSEAVEILTALNKKMRGLYQDATTVGDECYAYDLKSVGKLIVKAKKHLLDANAALV